MHRGKELGAAAMHRDDHVGRQSRKLDYRMFNVILRCRTEMKPAEHRVQFADPGHRHRGLDRVDQPDMAARRDDDEPASLDDIAGCMLVRMLVGDEAA
jgi:hypothetical protein